MWFFPIATLLLLCPVHASLSFKKFNWTPDDLGLSKYRNGLSNPLLPGLLPNPMSNSFQQKKPIEKPPKSYARIVKERVTESPLELRSPHRLSLSTIWTPRTEDNLQLTKEKEVGKG
jgi:hypothetical protein